VKKNVIIAILALLCGVLLLKVYGPALVGSKPKPPSGSLPAAKPAPRPAATPAPKKAGSGAEAGSHAFGSRVLRKDMQGSDVLQLQERLKLAGFVRENFMPGTFDDATEQALLKYQEGTPFLAEMYAFGGLPPPHKAYMDAALAAQLLRVPTPDKVLIRHTVAAKENLFRIATRFGIGPDSIKHLNNIGDPSAIKVGQGIWIVCDRSKATP
jgi:hypothetical protein